MLIEEYIVLLYPDGQSFVGIDRNSGGYPFRTPTLASTMFWNDYEDAKKYVDICSKENFKIKTLKIHLEI